ncbi:MAG TPA: long-chain fatty acid--CoA ligase [Streptosporangiaceae bacterium]|nr:long-chain fatty acid--CoA ligase [Streptosporangiaceae bacterium]HEX2821009.1 long-chain fatty acid--CoA ligase [Streptosporangiaceae bacterium]
MREFSIPALSEIPATANLADAVFRRAAEQPQAVVMRRPGPDGGWQDVTAGQFSGEVVAVAKGLIAAGIEAGDRVALMSHTRYEWTLIDYAVWVAGAVPVPVYETSSAEQAEWILSDSGARACFVETAAYEQIIDGLRDQVPALKYVWRIEDPGDGASPLTGGGTSVGDEVITARAATAKASDVATIIYTSGTTGRPKGCELTHENLLADVRNAFLGPLAIIAGAQDPSTLLFLPLAHVFARIIEVGCIEGGIVLGYCQDVNELLPALASFRPTFILAVPRVFEKVYNGAEQRALSERKGAIFGRAARVAIAYSRAIDTPGGPAFGLRAQHGLFDRLVYGKLRAALGGRAHYAMSGGAALTERLCHFFRGVGVTVLEGYGLTETTGAATVNRPDRNKIGMVGQPLPGVAVKVAEDGEILISGANVFRGYWQNDAATKETLTADGWFRTGDIGELDDEGFLRITGRKKEMIVTAGGKNVAPAVLEDRLRSHALISQTMVVGDGRPFIAALITVDPEALGPWKERHGKPADATVATLREDPDLIAAVQEAVDDANKVVSRAESIRRFRILEGDFTQESGQLTVKLGIRRGVLMKDFAADIEALYS